MGVTSKKVGRNLLMQLSGVLHIISGMLCCADSVLTHKQHASPQHLINCNVMQAILSEYLVNYLHTEVPSGLTRTLREYQDKRAYISLLHTV